jgi:hypothetical protein
MKRAALTAFLVACALLGGCAAPVPLSTPSGNPEVSLPGVTKKQALDQIVARAVSRGMQVRSINDYSLTLGKRVGENFAAVLLYGSRYDSEPELRMTFTTIEGPGGVLIYARAEMVTNPGSAFERRNDVTGGARHDLQAILESLRAGFATAPAPPMAIMPTLQPTLSQATLPVPADTGTVGNCRWVTPIIWKCS